MVSQPGDVEFVGPLPEIGDPKQWARGVESGAEISRREGKTGSFPGVEGTTRFKPVLSQKARARAEELSTARRVAREKEFVRIKALEEQKRKSQLEKIQEQKRGEQTRREGLQRTRVQEGLRRVEEGKITSFSFQTTEGKVTIRSKKEAETIRKNIEGRGRVRFGKAEFVKEGKPPTSIKGKPLPPKIDEVQRDVKVPSPGDFARTVIRGADVTERSIPSQTRYLMEAPFKAVAYSLREAGQIVKPGMISSTSKTRGVPSPGDFAKTTIKGSRTGIGIGLGATAELVPTTTKQIALAGIGIKAFVSAPVLLRVPTSAVISGVSGAKVFDKEYTIEQKVASGFVSVLAGTGAVIESVPFVRGVSAQTIGRVTGKFRPIKKIPEGAMAIRSVPNVGDIGIIPPKSPAKTGVTTKVILPKTSPLKRGGFGVKQSEKILFLGKGQKLATSQIGLFKQGKEIPIKREFFVTPQEPSIKIAETRESRLGLTGLGFPKSQNIKISFGLPSKPQIGVLTKGTVGKIETGKGFVIGPGSELEAIKSFGTIGDVKKVGVTTIKGQGVDIFKFKIKDVKGTTSIKNLGKLPSTSTSARVSGESAISTVGISRTTTRAIFPLISISQPSRGIPQSISPKVSRGISHSISVSPSSSFRGVSQSISPSRPKSITPSLSLSRSVVGTSVISRTQRTPGRYRTTTGLITAGFMKGISIPKYTKATFGVSVRRRGKFKPIGSGLSLPKAITVGRSRAIGTIARTFKITPQTKGLVIGGVRTPKGFKQKKGLIFIEQKELALQTVRVRGRKK